jgi:predicted nucleic acid-binding protein
VADSWIAATAIVHGATLLHKDPEFEAFQEIAQEILK